VLALFRDLLALRRTDPVLSSSTRAELSAEARGDVLIVRRQHGGEQRILLASFSACAVDVASLGVPAHTKPLLVAGRPSSPGTLAAHSAVIVALRADRAGA
jgi:maltooligosyltrehalose trehalohydrolase